MIQQVSVESFNSSVELDGGKMSDLKRNKVNVQHQMYFLMYNIK